MIPLTPTQAHLKRFIAVRLDDGIGPSLQEMAEFRGSAIEPTRQVVLQLEKKGHVKRTRGVYRSVEII